MIQKCTEQGWADENNVEENEKEGSNATSIAIETFKNDNNSPSIQKILSQQQYLDDNMHVLELGLAASARMALDAIKALLLVLTESSSSSSSDSSTLFISDENERVSTLRLAEISSFLSTLASSAPATLTVTLDDLSCAGLGMLGTLSAGAIRKSTTRRINQSVSFRKALYKIAADAFSSLAMSCIDSRPAVRLHAQEVLQTVLLHLITSSTSRSNNTTDIETSLLSTPQMSLTISAIYPVCFAIPAATLVLACAIKPGVNIIIQAESLLIELYNSLLEDNTLENEGILPLFSNAVTLLSEARLALKMPPNTDVLQSNSLTNPYVYAATTASASAAAAASAMSSSSSNRPDISSPSSRPILTSGAPLFSPAASGGHGLSPTPNKAQKSSTNAIDSNESNNNGGGRDNVTILCERTISGVVQLVSRTFLQLLPLSNRDQNRTLFINQFVQLIAEVFESTLRATEECKPPALPLQESLRECARNTIQVIRTNSTTTGSVNVVEGALLSVFASGRFDNFGRIFNN